MSEPAWLILVVVLPALVFDFTNGRNDAANALVTVVSPGVLTPAQAVLLAGVLNVAGAFYSTAVAKTNGAGIVRPTAVTQLTGAAGLNAQGMKPGLAATILSLLLGLVLGFAAMLIPSWGFFRAHPPAAQPSLPEAPARLRKHSYIKWVESC